LPTVDGEPRYESINVGFYNQNYSRIDRFDDYDARQAAYWSLLAGACGHTYGNNNIWQMWQPGRNPAIGANIPWYEALDHPGAFQMGHLRRLFESRAWEKLVPMRSLVVDGPRTGGGKIRAALLKEDLIEAVIGLAPNLFYGTQLAGCVVVRNSSQPITSSARSRAGS